MAGGLTGEKNDATLVRLIVSVKCRASFGPNPGTTPGTFLMESASKLSSERADKPVQAKKESISLNALWESISKATAFGLPRLTIRRNLRRVTASSSSSIDEEENIDRLGYRIYLVERSQTVTSQFRAKQLDDDGYFERLTRSAQRATKIRVRGCGTIADSQQLEMSPNSFSCLGGAIPVTYL